MSDSDFLPPMTEADWLTGNAQLMLAHLRDAGLYNRRKLLLLAAACCRGMGKLLPDVRAVEMVEAAADGPVDPDTIEFAMHGLEVRFAQNRSHGGRAAILAVIHALEAALEASLEEDAGRIWDAVSLCLRMARRAVGYAGGRS